MPTNVLAIDSFKSKLAGGGARPNLFKITLNFPAVAGGSTELAAFLVKAASLPGSYINQIPVNWRGRTIQIAGDRVFDQWQVSVLNDTTMDLRNAFERWMNAINSHTQNTGLATPTSYMVDMAVEQLNKAGDVTKRYDFVGAWPTQVTPIELSNDATNAIEEFACTFAYLYWTSPQSTT